jgi:hypothetical protein
MTPKSAKRFSDEVMRKTKRMMLAQPIPQLEKA